MSTPGKSSGGGGRKNPRLHQKVKTARGRTTSSTKWLQRQLNDPYVQKAKAMGYRSRAAFKIAELDDKFKFFKSNMTVVDLGAAPGGWSQVAMERCKGNSTIIGLDLLPIDTITGITFLEMDFMEEEAPEALCALLPDGKADIVISDMAPNASGTPSLDHLRIMGLVETAADFAFEILKPGGHFVSKVWQGGTERETLQMLQKRFDKVRHAKPASSRKGSSETFLVAMGFRG
jgi:23S rRNA (uridine2552-2'-O)-methyltransferase